MNSEILDNLDKLDKKINMLLRVAQTYIELNPDIKQAFSNMRTDKGCEGSCGSCEEAPE